MKRFAPIIVTIAIILAFVGAAWYEIRAGQDNLVSESLAPATTVSITGATIKNASDGAAKFLSKLTAYGKVPLDASSLPTKPTPLFVPAKQ